MTHLPSYLSKNRHGTYYFRRYIQIRSQINKLSYFRYNLSTDSHHLALKIALTTDDIIINAKLGKKMTNSWEPSNNDVVNLFRTPQLRYFF